LPVKTYAKTDHTYNEGNDDILQKISWKLDSVTLGDNEVNEDNKDKE